VDEHAEGGAARNAALPTKEEMTPEERRLAHKLNATIKRVTDDLETRHQFNTVISSLMELANDIADLPKDAPHHDALMGHALSAFVRMLSPVAPHLAEQLWEQLGGRGFCMHSRWPDFDAAWLEMDEQTVVVQVNGKVRGRVTVSASATEEERKSAALACHEAQAHLAGREIVKVIVPPGGKLVSVVVKEEPKARAETVTRPAAEEGPAKEKARPKEVKEAGEMPAEAKETAKEAKARQKPKGKKKSSE